MERIFFIRHRHKPTYPASILISYVLATLSFLIPAVAQTGAIDPWQVRHSDDRMPHFEQADGCKILYVDGSPFTVLAVEIRWWDLIYGRYAETQHAYDYLYPAAQQMGMNAMKVPVKWSMVEPEKGIYDFSYIDHVKDIAEEHKLKLILNWFGHYASGDGTIYGNLTGY